MNRSNKLSFSVALYDVANTSAMADWLDAMFSAPGREKLRLRFRTDQKWKAGRFSELEEFLSSRTNPDQNLGFIAADGDLEQPVNISAAYQDWKSMGINALVVSMLGERVEDLSGLWASVKSLLSKTACEYGLGIIRSWNEAPERSLAGVHILGRNDRDGLLAGAIGFDLLAYDRESGTARRRYAKGRLIEICDFNILNRKHLDFVVGSSTVTDVLAQVGVVLERTGDNYVFFASDQEIDVLKKALAPAILLRNPDSGYTAHSFSV